MNHASATDTADAPVLEHVSRAELDRILSAQRAAFLKEGTPSGEVRRGRIDRLMLAVFEYADELAEAAYADNGRKIRTMTKTAEILGLMEEAEETRAKLEEWMAPDETDGPFQAVIEKNPLGVVGIMPAWNGPVALLVQPGVSALAAGNRLMLKTNEMQPRTAAVLAKAVAKHLSEEEVAVIVGDLATTQEFSKLPLDHLMFTGSPSVGRIVAANAAQNLVPVTLELGGKNPAVVSRSADLDDAARKIATTRLFNNGQICTCPDYAFVPRERLDEFVELVKDQFRALFPTVIDNEGITAIVDDKNFDRVRSLIEDAVSNGATKIEVADPSEADRLPSREHRLFAPTILLDVPESAAVAQNEIFGPVLPIYAYDDIEEAIGYVNTRESPLAAYYYGQDDAEFDRFVRHTRSGGVTRNDGLLHQFVPNAPFGGVGQSGTGAYHGKAGFDEFVHLRTIATQTADTSAVAGLTGINLANPAMAEAGDQGVVQAIALYRERVGA